MVVVPWKIAPARCAVTHYGERRLGRWEKEYDLSHFILKMY
eukprot:COSAG06_NODE_66647_length_254_cov_0.380645_1_plen_40_part_01